MLNRRSLRIKVMQSLFALQQCKEAAYELCRDKIAQSFQPDLNYHNPEVKEAMFDVIRFWLNKGVDGFRLDIISAIYEAMRTGKRIEIKK